MNKTLICYFSATGNTKKKAEEIKKEVQGDLFEIEPVEKYTKEDLNWINQESRSSKEMKDSTSRPKISKKVENIKDYSTIYIGYPIWWYTAPTIINSFIEENDLSGKEIHLFSTSGGSTIEKSIKDLKEKYPHLTFVE